MNHYDEKHCFNPLNMPEPIALPGTGAKEFPILSGKFKPGTRLACEGKLVSKPALPTARSPRRRKSSAVTSSSSQRTLKQPRR
jgi:hypothetical protein